MRLFIDMLVLKWLLQYLSIFPAQKRPNNSVFLSHTELFSCRKLPSNNIVRRNWWGRVESEYRLIWRLIWFSMMTLRLQFPQGVQNFAVHINPQKESILAFHPTLSFLWNFSWLITIWWWSRKFGCQPQNWRKYAKYFDWMMQTIKSKCKVYTKSPVLLDFKHNMHLMCTRNPNVFCLY